MLPKRNFSEEKVSLEINLEKLFGKRINDSSLRRAIAERAIEIVLERVEKGKGVDGKGTVVPLAKYDPEYKASLPFKAFDKTSTVNMKLTGSMHSSVDLLEENASKIEIGIDNEDAPKAYNHLVGDTVKRRPWLGLTEGDLNKLKNEFKSEIGSEKVTAADIFNRQNLAKLIRVVSKKSPFEIEVDE